MFMSLLTADAAAQHGHEYSPQREPSPAARPFYYLPRSLSSLPAAGLRTLSYMSGLQSEETKSTDGSESKLPAKVQRSISFADDVPSTVDDESETAGPRDQGMLTRTPSLSSVSTTQAGASPAIGPVDSTSNRRKRRSRKDGDSDRLKQCLNFAHPPPLGSKYQRLHIKPRVLLQLQEVSAGGRPRPAFEVVPSSRLPVRLSRKFARLHHNVNTALRSDDMVVCEVKGHRAYTDDDDWDAREPVGLLRVTADGNADVTMNDGSTWRSSPRNRGRYDFVYHDEHGVPRTVRWVSKPMRKPARSDSSSSTGLLPAPDARRFVFSSILPDSRRHPIVATMTPTGMEIFSHYKVPGKKDRSEVVTPSESDMQTEDDFFDEDAAAPDSFPIETDDLLRKLILVSGIWVCMQERWSTATRAVSQSASAQPRAKAASGTLTKASIAEAQAESPVLGPATDRARPVSLHLPRRSRPPLTAATFTPLSPAHPASRTLSLIVPRSRTESSPSRSNAPVTPMTPMSMTGTPIRTESPSSSDQSHRRATAGHSIHRLAHVLPSRRHSTSYDTSLGTPTVPLQTIPSGVPLEEEPFDEPDTTDGASRPALDPIPMTQIPGQPEGWHTPDLGTPTAYSVSVDGGGSDSGERKKKWGTLRRVMTLGRSRRSKRDE